MEALVGFRPNKNILCFGQPDPTYRNRPTLDFFYENAVFFVGVFIVIKVSILKKKNRSRPYLEFLRPLPETQDFFCLALVRLMTSLNCSHLYTMTLLFSLPNCKSANKFHVGKPTTIFEIQTHLYLWVDEDSCL